MGGIEGDNYPPPTWAIYLSQFTGILQLVGMSFMLFGDGIWEALPFGGEPEWYGAVKDNKMQVFMMIFVLNSVANSQLSTGAFEIYYNDELVFSKIAVGRMPSGREVLQTINAIRSR